jgi:phage terminase large subunit-like protein
VCLGFDGSWTRDATALMGCTVGDEPHLFTLGLWEQGGPGWRVPLDEVDDAVRYAFDTFEVVEMAVDKAHWRSEVERWRLDFGERVMDMPQSAGTMVPATDRLYQAIMEGHMTHDGHEGLSRHVHNAVAQDRPGGVQIRKPRNAPKDGSPVGRIDAAVASIMAFDRAGWHAQRAPTAAPFAFYG